MASHTSFSHRGPGYNFGGTRAEMMRKRLTYIQKHGAAFLFEGKPPPVPGYPETDRAPAEPRTWQGKGPSDDTRVQMDLLAELVAEGMSLSKAAKVLGKSKSRTQQIWHRIVDEMGAQAV